MNFQTWLRNRESGFCGGPGDQNNVFNRVYKTMAPFHHWNDITHMPDATTNIGAVFNLEFSPEGNVLVGVCEKKSIILFDAITTKQIHSIPDAHTDYVNCVKFLDNRMFATCSDDTTVAIWDLRQLKNKVRSLHGHSNWVKNIEYSRKNNLLVTSGFDGSIFTWDINSHTEQGLIYQKVFHTSGLMRCRITPDGEKLIICTTGGYIMIVHNLDLTTLHKDLCGFRPGIYRLMQLGEQYIPQAAKFDHVFSKQQKKNRVELVTDFPEEDDAEVILALEIHPQGNAFLSRNISHDELSEWSCVHDLNEEPDDITEKIKRKRKHAKDDDELSEETSSTDRDPLVFTVNRRVFDRSSFNRGVLAPPPPPGAHISYLPNVAHRNGSNNSQQQSTTSSSQQRNQRTLIAAHRQENFVPDIWAAEVTLQERAIRQNRSRGANSATGYNFVYAISSGVLSAASTTRSQGTMTSNNNAGTRTQTIRRYSSSSSSTSSSSTQSNQQQEQQQSMSPDFNSAFDSNSSTSSNDSPTHQTNIESIQMRLLQPNTRTTHQIFQNPKKLLYYKQEPNSGKGFIKEPCFSRDGRVICSPYGRGVRLLGFTENCLEFPRQQSGKRSTPQELVEIQNISAHSDIVFSTKFSPRESLLVTGCRNGKITWYYPKF